jgi:hypothetical protein
MDQSLKDMIQSDCCEDEYWQLPTDVAMFSHYQKMHNAADKDKK